MQQQKNDSNNRLFERSFITTDMFNEINKSHITGEITGSQYDNDVFTGAMLRNTSFNFKDDTIRDEKENTRVFDMVINNNKEISNKYRQSKIDLPDYNNIILNINAANINLDNYMNNIFEESYIFSPILFDMFFSNVFLTIKNNKINNILIKKMGLFDKTKMNEYFPLLKNCSSLYKLFLIVLYNSKLNINNNIVTLYNNNVSYIKLTKKKNPDVILYKRKIKEVINKLTNGLIDTKPTTNIITNISYSGIMCANLVLAVNAYSYSGSEDYYEFHDISVNVCDTHKFKIYEFECVNNLIVGIVVGDSENQNILIDKKNFKKNIVKRVVFPKIQYRKKIDMTNIIKKYICNDITDTIGLIDENVFYISGLISDIELNVISLEKEKRDAIDALPNMDNLLIDDSFRFYIKSSSGIILICGKQTNSIL